MNGVVNALLIGRWGNQLFTYAFARGYAQSVGAELRTGRWPGQIVFEINDPPIQEEFPTIRTEWDIVKGETNITIRTYAQMQAAVDYYSRSQVRKWFTFRPEIAAALRVVPHLDTCAHLRHGDFLGTPGFVAVSKESFYKAADQFRVPRENMALISEDWPISVPGLHPDVPFLPDFHALMQARILFRANSSFSWWAATLGHAERIFAPELAGIPGGSGKPVEVPFVEGNHPSISRQHWSCTDMRIRE